METRRTAMVRDFAAERDGLVSCGGGVGCGEGGEGEGWKGAEGRGGKLYDQAFRVSLPFFAIGRGRGRERRRWLFSGAGKC